MRRPKGKVEYDRIEFKSYKPGQAAEHFLPYLKQVPDWFIDLGPASAVEYLDARERFPEVKLLGLEPSPIGYKAARCRWPEGVPLLNVAAWDSDGAINLHKANDLLHGTAFVEWANVMDNDPTGTSSDMVVVTARSLDSLDVEYGPFTKAVIWMDVEGAERRVLAGAKSLLERGMIIGINIEMRPAYAEELHALLRGYGFELIREYFACETVRDEVWVR